MEFVTREVQTNQSEEGIVSQFMLDEDFNVPDSKCDVKRVIANEGRIKIEETRVVENYVKIIGKVEFQILYVGEGMEPSFCSMSGKMPFEEMVYVEDASGLYRVKHSRVDLQTQRIHSRKLRLKAMIELEVESERQTMEQLVTDIICETPLFKKTREIDLLKLHTSKRDTYRIKEEITLPGTKETIGTLLWSDVVHRRMDTKLLTDELQISGELQVFCFYESPDGKLDWLEKQVPYQGKIDCYGAESAMFHQVRAELEEVNVDVRMDEDGEMRIIGIEGTLKLNVNIYEEECMNVLEDVYSLEKQCKLEKKEVCYEQLILQNHSKCKVTQSLLLPELKNDILQICHSSGNLQLDHMETVEDGVMVEGVIHIAFLFVKSNDEIPFEMWQGMVPFSHLIECKEADTQMQHQITHMLEQLHVNLLGGNEVEIKACLAFHCFFKRTIKEPMMFDMQMEPVNWEELGKRPGVIGYIVREKDDLWSLAKRYHTTMECIREVNDLEGEQLKIGDRILIFKENATIL